MASLQQAANFVLKKNMGLKKSEKFLVVTDEGKLKIGNAFCRAAEKIAVVSKLIDMPVAKYNGEEPPADVAREMLNADVIVMATTKSLSHTEARRNATKKGARIASMPGITEAILKRVCSVDYKKMRARGMKLAKIMAKSKKVCITTKKGADLLLDIRGRKHISLDAGTYTKKGKWGNLPAGECALAPITANGIVVVDGVFAGVGKVRNPIKIIFKNGYATKIEGKQEAHKLKSMLKWLPRKNYFIAELGIGINDKATLCGITLEDEKVLGTAHIAIGDNTSFYGGKNNALVHLDGVFRKPTIVLDDKKVMDNGKLLI